MTMQEFSQSPFVSSTAYRQKSDFRPFVNLLKRFLLTIFKVWPARYRQRAALRELEDFRLEDMGISREAALEESRKRFWR